jgi:hypothetical protein
MKLQKVISSMHKYSGFILSAVLISVESFATPVLPSDINKNALEGITSELRYEKEKQQKNIQQDGVTVETGKNVNDVITPVTNAKENSRINSRTEINPLKNTSKSNITGVIRPDSSGIRRSKQSNVSSKDYIVKLPVAEIYVIKREQDTSFQFADASGRYAIYKGDLYDLWDNKRKLNTKEKMEYSFTHIPVERLRSVSGLNEIVSDGSKNSTTKGREVFMFLDPTDYQSIDVVKAFSKSINSGFYHTRIVLVATDKNEETVSLFACASATNKEKLTALTSKDYSILHETYHEECVPGNFIQNTNAFSQYLGISEFPFIIAPSGRFVSGYITNPFEFIQNKK